MKCKCKKILSAFFSRLFFFLHGLILVTIVVFVKQDSHYIFLMAGVILLFPEMIITLKETEKGEWRWFSPMVFLYLCSVIPSVFVIELSFLEFRLNFTSGTNITFMDLEPKVYGMMIQSTEGLMIFVLVIGRWLMPKGDMDRDQLSDLLLTYLALGADMLDLLQLFKDMEINVGWTLTVVGLCIFEFSTLQFTIVLTQRESLTSKEKSDTEESLSDTTMIVQSCWTSGAWSTLITVVLQDGPYFIYRLYLLNNAVFNDSLGFFTLKNFIIVILQIYKLIVILCRERRERKRCQEAT